MAIYKDTLIRRILFTAFWLVATFGFVAEELLPFLEPLRTPVMLLADALVVIVGLMSLSWRRHKADLIFIATYVVISVISTLAINHNSIMTWGNGTRVFLGPLFVVPVLRYFWDSDRRREKFLQSLDKTAWVFLWLQTVCVTWQFFKYGAGDHGGGSMGNFCSGMVSFSIYLFSFYLMRRRYNPQRLFQSMWENKVIVFLLFPTFLNETKISFFLLLMYFVLLIPFNRQSIKRFLLMAPFAVLAVVGGGYLYIKVLPQSNDDFLDTRFILNEYLFDSDIDMDAAAGAALWVLEYDGSLPDVPRFTKIGLTKAVMDENPGHYLWGFGMGIFNGSKNLGVLPIVEHYDWMFYGTVPYCLTVFLQLGLLGSIWFVAFLIHFYCTKPGKGFKRFSGTMLMSLLSFIILLFYADMLRMLEFAIVFYVFTFTMWEKPSQPAIIEPSPAEPRLKQPSDE